MEKVLGIVMVVVGIVIGLYIGCYLMLYGGIVEVVTGIKNNLQAGQIAIGILRIIFASAAGWLGFIVLALPGFHLIFKD